MFRIQSHPANDYSTGKNPAGEPIIIGLLYPYLCCLLFDISGEFVEARFRHVACPARTVRKGGPFLIEDPDFQDALHKQIALWGEELEFEEQPILIQKFASPEFLLGIELLPRHFSQFQDAPDDFTEEDRFEYPTMIDEWLADGNFVFWWRTDYYLDKHGEII